MMPSLTLAIHPIHDQDSKSSKNEGELMGRHLQKGIELSVISLLSTSGRSQDMCQVKIKDRKGTCQPYIKVPSARTSPCRHSVNSY